MYEEIENVKAPCLETRQIEIEGEAEICDETRRVVTPDFREIERLEGMIF